MQYPLVLTAVLFSLGLAAGKITAAPFVIFYGLAVLFLVLSVLSWRKGLRFKIFLFCLVFLLGAVWLKNQLILPKAHIARRIFYKLDNTCALKGFINNEPGYRMGRTSFVVTAQEAQFARLNYRVCGSVYVCVRGILSLNYGDRLMLEGKLFRPYQPRAAKGRGGFLASRGIYAAMNVEDACFVTVLGKGAGSPAYSLALRMKDGVESLINQYAPQPAAAVLEAMMLGEKKDIPPLLYRSMMNTGTVHILVVSGFNTSLVIFCVFLVLKLARLPRLWRLFLALPILFLYCLMAGASTPVVRATVMSVVFMSAYLVKRQPDIYNSCALAALLILLVEPRQLFDVGAQLSFVSVISIVFFYPKIKALLRLGAVKPAWIRFFSEGFLVSLSAWIGTAGLVAYYFKILSPIAVIANIFIVPLATLITLCGFSLLAAALGLPLLAPAFAASAQVLVTLLIKVNAALLSLPGAYFYLPSP